MRSMARELNHDRKDQQDNAQPNQRCCSPNSPYALEGVGLIRWFATKSAAALTWPSINVPVVSNRVAVRWGAIVLPTIGTKRPRGVDVSPASI